MIVDWQTVMVLGLIAISAAVVVRRIWETLRPSEDDACGGCEQKNSRPSDAAPIRRPFVSIEALEQRRHV
jgi:hypothetical protein